MNNSEILKDRKAQFRIGFTIVNIAIILATLAVGCMSIISSCEHDARYFLPTTMVKVFWVMLCISILLSFCSLLLFKSEPISHLSSQITSAKVARFSSILPAIVTFLITLFALFEEMLGQWGNYIMVLGAISTAFFILKVFIRPIASKALTGMATFGLCAVIIASLYLDFTIELNSHFKLLTQFSVAGIILGVVADIRASLSSPFYDSPKSVQRNYVRISARGYVFLKTLSIALSLICSTVVILYFGEGSSEFGMHYLLYSFFSFTYAISSTCDLTAAVISVIKSHI